MTGPIRASSAGYAPEVAPPAAMPAAPPASPAPVEAEAPPPAPPVTDRQALRTCLIVDDSRVVRKVSRRIVEGLGYAVTEAENGEEALARCRAAMPALILLDWDMPVMTGIEFLTAVRALDGGDRPKAMFCTSHAAPHDIHQGFAAGADEYVTKPFDEPKLRAKLERIGAI
ncbi:MAG TPA: response regulator [Novosphingobium sp.]|nr:response regulator [Novosphingobium sp.]